MINKYLHILICLIILLLGMSFVPPAAADSNPPALPNVFTGTVKINEENAPIGIEVRAYIENILAGSAPVEDAGEYRLRVKGFSTDEGKLITFMVGSLTAAETQVYFHETSPRILDLTILDNSAPETTANAPEGWQNSSFTVTLSAIDNLGDSFLNATFFKLDEAPFEIGNSVEITENGNHSITYYSDDFAGNVEAAKTVYAKLDTVAPVTSDDVPDGWQNSSFTVTFNVNDLAPKNTFFKLDEAPFEIGNSVEITENGNHSITYYSEDLAGNIEVEKTVY
ncbi:MAG: hypothetical protein PHW56_06260, partial [Methanosarcinaceae archaeon]|nr:hypothetical protein [Methanosarcinaceae archaeon]